MTRGGCPPWPVPNCDGGDACWDECEHWEEFVALGLAEADAIDKEDRPRGLHRRGATRVKAETTLPPMLAPETKKALLKAGENVAKWTAERDRLIKEAVAAGGSLREVGDAAGISHTAVKFIAHGRPRGTS